MGLTLCKSPEAIVSHPASPKPGQWSRVLVYRTGYFSSPCTMDCSTIKLRRMTRSTTASTARRRKKVEVFICLWLKTTWRIKGVQVYSGIDIQYTTGVQLYRYTVHYRCSGVHVYNSTGVQLYRYTVHYRCTVAHLYTCTEPIILQGPRCCRTAQVCLWIWVNIYKWANVGWC